MLNKTKKVAFLTTGLAGALVVSSAVGIALSSCTTSNTSSSDTSNKFTYSIDWTDQNQLKQLTIDEQGLVYSSADKSEIITVAPNTAATSFVIPASVRYITGYNLITKNSSGAVATSTSYGAFQNQTSLISITFASSNTLVSIGDSSFKGCTYLSSITLPSSTTVVYNSAFENCTNLRNIGLANVSYIGSAAFKGAMANGADVSIDLSSATYIGDNAFNGSTSLANVDLSKNTTLTYIGISAFSGALVSGDSTTTIDLSKATLLKTISNSAFQNCTNLGSVVLSTTGALTTIGANAFNGATSLTQVGSTANTFTAPSSLGNYATTTVNSSTYVSSGIGTYAFANTKITAIDLSNTTATTPFTNATFKNMTALASVNFGSSSKITTIPYSLFENDSALTTLTLPASITSIANGSNNDSTSTDNVDAKSPFYNSGLVTINMNSITSYGTGNITLTSSITASATTIVPYGLFQGLTNLKTVYLKAGTVGINTRAFDGTSSLTTVKEGSSIINEDNGDGFLIPATLEWTGYYAFRNSAIKTVAFANASTENATNNLWYLGQGTFENATSLTTVDLTQANTSTSHTIPASDAGTGSNAETGNGLFAISTSLFKNISTLTTVKLPTSVTKIFTEAFVGNTKLESVNFGELTGLLAIDNNNFNNTQLISIDFSNMTNAAAISSLSNSFTNTSSTVFSNLPSNAIVKLPSSMTLSSGLNTTSFTTTSGSTTSRVSITYPNGLNVTTSTLTVGSSTYTALGATSSSGTTSNPMLKYVSNDFNLANTTSGSSIQEYYPRTFFGNAKLQKLTLSATNLYKTTTTSGTNSYSQQSSLFVHLRGANGTITSSEYDDQYLPFGNNSSLTDFEFIGFNINSSPTYPDATTSAARATVTDNPLYKTTAVTWAQVATVINKFASNDVNAPTQWPTATTGQVAANNINYDSTLSGAQGTVESGDNKNNDKYVLNITDVQAPLQDGTGQNNTVQQFTISVPNSMPASTSTTSPTDVYGQSFYHNGVKWTLTVYSANHKTNPGAITLVGENINVYRASRPNDYSSGNANEWQVCFNQGESVASKITVTLQICPSTTSTK